MVGEFMVNLLEQEKVEPLGNNRQLIVSPCHTFGTDAVLLANFAAVRKRDRACDMGTGCGIIPLIWSKGETGEVFALDIQPRAVDQLTRSIELNGLGGRITPMLCDIRQLKGLLEFGSFDLVTMNPPYKPVGTGIESLSEAQRIARHEITCNIDDAVSAASALLKYGGRFCMCHRPERLCDIICAMRSQGVEAKRLRFVFEREGREPWLILIEGRKGGKAGLRIEKNLIMKHADGSVTDEFRKMFGDYMDGHQ